MPFQKDKVIVFGGSSFIGGNLIKFLKKKYKVVNVSKTTNIKGIQNINIDFSKNFKFKKLNKIQPKYIFFLVSLDHTDSEKNIKKSFDINFYSLCKILENKNILTKLKSVVYVSTLQVYGGNKLIKSEKTPIEPKNIYALTHVLCENYLKYFSKRNLINTVIYRVSNSFGVPFIERKNTWTNVINDFVKNTFEKKEIVIKSHGLFQRDFIYIDDLCNFILSTFKKYKGYQLINTGSYESTSIINIANQVKNIGEKFLKEHISLKILGKKTKGNFNLKFNSHHKSKIEYTDKSIGIKKIFKYLKEK